MPPPTTPSAAAASAAETEDVGRSEGRAPANADLAKFLAAVGRHRQALAAHLSGAKSLQFHDRTLEISVPSGDTWLRERLAKEANRLTLEEALRATWGEGSGWKLIEDESASSKNTKGKPESTSGVTADDKVLDDPRVQTVLEIFGGSVESVKES